MLAYIPSFARRIIAAFTHQRDDSVLCAGVTLKNDPVEK